MVTLFGMILLYTPMSQVSRRSIMGLLVGATCGLSGCSDFLDSEHKMFHLELINDGNGPVTFSVLIEQGNDVISWESYEVEEETDSASVGQHIPALGIEEVVEGPLDIRVEADGQYTEVTLESDELEWIPDRTEANLHVSVWLTETGEVVAMGDT